MQTAADIPLLVTSENSRSERRISPSWTVAHLKERLEPITGIPASSQSISLKVGSQPAKSLAVPDEEHTQLTNFPLQRYAELQVSIPARVVKTFRQIQKPTRGERTASSARSKNP